MHTCISVYLCIYTCAHMCMCVSVYTCMDTSVNMYVCTCTHVCTCHDAMYKSEGSCWFSPFTLWVPGIELKSSGFMESTSYEPSCQSIYKFLDSWLPFQCQKRPTMQCFGLPKCHGLLLAGTIFPLGTKPLQDLFPFP